jgi:hypothetical protein
MTDNLDNHMYVEYARSDQYSDGSSPASAAISHRQLSHLGSCPASAIFFSWKMPSMINLEIDQIT